MCCLVPRVCGPWSACLAFDTVSPRKASAGVYVLLSCYFEKVYEGSLQLTVLQLPPYMGPDHGTWLMQDPFLAVAFCDLWPCLLCGSQQWPPLSSTVLLPGVLKSLLGLTFPHQSISWNALAASGALLDGGLGARRPPPGPPGQQLLCSVAKTPKDNCSRSC